MSAPSDARSGEPRVFSDHSPPPVELPGPLEAVCKRFPFLRAELIFGFHFSNRWNENACPLMAAALAFFGLLSMFPLALAAVTILANTLAGDLGLLDQFATFIASFFPGAAGQNLKEEIERAVVRVAVGSNVTLTSAFAFGALLWAGRSYFDTLATVMSRIFPGSQPRPFLQHQITLWSLLLGAGALFLLSSSTTFALSLVRSLAEQLPDLFFNRAPLFWNLLGRFVSWGLTLGMFWLLYRYAPNRKHPPHRRIVWASAVVAAVGWEIGKWAFASFLGNVTRYEQTYGSVAGVVVTMLWIYYASIIVLAGAQVGATWEDLKRMSNDQMPDHVASDAEEERVSDSNA